MKDNTKYIDFEVWKKLNKDKSLDIKTKPVGESIKDAKIDLLSKKYKSGKNDTNV
tara:strand:- start:406 stop:570 length:165 start_codon:yes stop_codon:yes gene_type:complete